MSASEPSESVALAWVLLLGPQHTVTCSGVTNRTVLCPGSLLSPRLTGTVDHPTAQGPRGRTSTDLRLTFYLPERTKGNQGPGAEKHGRKPWDRAASSNWGSSKGTGCLPSALHQQGTSLSDRPSCPRPQKGPGTGGFFGTSE